MEFNREATQKGNQVKVKMIRDFWIFGVLYFCDTLGLSLVLSSLMPSERCSYFHGSSGMRKT